MRQAFRNQPTLDCPSPDQVALNFQCRDEIVPILRALQHVYSNGEVRKSILDAIGKDVNRTTSKKKGRPGLDYWEILVLGAVRQGCNLDYDKLQNLAEEHRTMRLMMGIGSWEDLKDKKGRKKFDWRTLRDNVGLLQAETLQKLNQAIVAAGHVLVPEAAKHVRGDTFVVETNVHYPTESSLISDGLRKVLKVSSDLAKAHQVPGWRQHKQLHKQVRIQVREIGTAARSKKSNKEERIQKGYRQLLGVAKDILSRARFLVTTLSAMAGTMLAVLRQSAGQQELEHYIDLTVRVCDTARRRVLEGETVGNEEKIFSIFEPHTELIQRGKQPNPIQFGHNVLVIEDAVGFICYYEVVGKGVAEVNLVVPAMRTLQKRLNGKIECASFDRGFHSPENQKELAKIVKHPCLAPKGTDADHKQKQASVKYRQSRRRHPGVESTVGALQVGNGMERCRDRHERGYERYVGLGVLGRNLHVLGKLLIAQESPQSQAGKSKRKKAK